jgi:hypothetical protein
VVHGRKFYLAPPRRPGGPYYIRFEPPSNCGGRARGVHRSLRTTWLPTAKERAKKIIEPVLNGQWETAEKLKSRSGYATIGEIFERYQTSAEDRPGTVRNNISALRLLIRTVHRGDPDKQNASVLKGELIRQFERIRMAAARSEPERRRTRTSIRSYIVQARSVVAPRKMRFAGSSFTNFGAAAFIAAITPRSSARGTTRAHARPMNLLRKEWTDDSRPARGKNASCSPL